MFCTCYVDCGIRKLGIPCRVIGEREVAVLLLLLMGYSNATIGRELYLSEKTVRNYVSILLGKFGAENRIQLVLRVTASGFDDCLKKGTNVPKNRDICQMERKLKVGRMKEKNEGEVNRMLEELTAEEWETTGGYNWVDIGGGYLCGIGGGLMIGAGVVTFDPIAVGGGIGLIGGGIGLVEAGL